MQWQIYVLVKKLGSLELQASLALYQRFSCLWVVEEGCRSQ